MYKLRFCTSRTKSYNLYKIGCISYNLHRILPQSILDQNNTAVQAGLKKRTLVKFNILLKMYLILDKYYS